MGNQSSREQTDIEQLLSTWSPSQQTALRTQYSRFATSSTKEEVCNVSQFTQHLLDWIPTYFSAELATSFALYFDTQSDKKANMISFVGYVKSAKQLLSHTPADNVRAMYNVYLVAFKQYSCSLENYVQWTVNSAIPIWYQGNGTTDDFWRDTFQQSGATRLCHYLIYRQVKHKEELERRKQEEAALWTDSTNTTTNNTKSLSAEWEKQVTGTTQPVDESTFITWMMETPNLYLLTQLCAKYLLFGDTDQQENLHDQRIAGERAPAIEQPSGAMYSKGCFSRLVTVYDYFMLVRQLPPDALSWSDYERSQRRVTKDLEHQLVFSSKRDGNSWQIFSSRIVHQGATLIIIKSKEGAVFGGYADEQWEPVTDWYGNSSNYLFRIGSDYNDTQLPMNVWNGGQGSNDHFQYLCWGKKTLPNGNIFVMKNMTFLLMIVIRSCYGWTAWL